MPARRVASRWALEPDGDAVLTVSRDMRVLVLDDEPHRHEWFAAEGATLGWRMNHAWSADEAIQTLEQEPRFHVVFLDYDLAVLADDRRRRDGIWITGPNGAVAAGYLAHLLPLGQRPHHVHVHSWNPLGAEHMEGLLTVAGLNVSRRKFGEFSFERHLQSPIVSRIA